MTDWLTHFRQAAAERPVGARRAGGGDRSADVGARRAVPSGDGAAPCKYAEKTGCCRRKCHHPEASPDGDLVVHRTQCNPENCRHYTPPKPARRRHGAGPASVSRTAAPGAPPGGNLRRAVPDRENADGAEHGAGPASVSRTAAPHHALTVATLGMVITAHNEDPGEVRATVESALAAYPHDRLRIILIDDGSEAPIERGSLPDGPVEVVRHDRPRGVGRSRNHGYRIAVGREERARPGAESRRVTPAHRADVIGWHDAHMRFPLVDELLEHCKDETLDELEEALQGRPGASCLTVLAGKAMETGAIVSGASRDVRPDRQFRASGADMFWNRRDGLQPKWRLDGFWRDAGPWERVPCMMGAGYFMSANTARKLAGATEGTLWLDTAGRWGFSEQALSVKAFLLGVPVLAARDVFTRHLYRSSNPVEGAAREAWRNVTFATARLFHRELWRMRWRPYCCKRLPEHVVDELAGQARKAAGERPWSVARERRVFTHLCGKNAPITEPHPSHAWLDDVADAVRHMLKHTGGSRPAEGPADAARGKADGHNAGGEHANRRRGRVLQWRPGEATDLVRRMAPEAEITCIEMPGRRSDNWWDVCRALDVRLVKAQLDRGYVHKAKAYARGTSGSAVRGKTGSDSSDVDPANRPRGGFDLVLVGGERQAECVAQAEELLASHGRVSMTPEELGDAARGRTGPGSKDVPPANRRRGRILTNKSADRMLLEDDARHKEEERLEQAGRRGGSRTAPTQKSHPARNAAGGATESQNRGPQPAPRVATRRRAPTGKRQPASAHTPVTVLLLNWKRPENIPKVLDSLEAQTVRPRVWLWDNSPGGLPQEVAARVDRYVWTDRNAGCIGRWWLAAAADTPYVCSIDDDLKLTDEEFLADAVKACAEKCPDGVVGVFGWRSRAGWPPEAVDYKGGRHTNGASEDVPVDLVKGRFMLFRRELLERVPLRPPADVLEYMGEDAKDLLVRCDDIYLNLMIAYGGSVRGQAHAESGETAPANRPRGGLVAGSLGKWGQRCADVGRQDGRALASDDGHYRTRGKAIEALLHHFQAAHGGGDTGEEKHAVA